MGMADPQLSLDVVAVIQKHAQGDYSPTVKASSKGTYHSLTIPVTVTSKAHIEAIYSELNTLELVRCIL
jgi:hypothetical protein